MISILVTNISSKKKQQKILPVSLQLNVEELKQILELNFGVSKNKQILSSIWHQKKIILIDGFNLDFFEIHNNSILELKSLQKIDKNEVSININKLGFNYDQFFLQQTLHILNSQNEIQQKINYNYAHNFFINQEFQLIKKEEQELFLLWKQFLEITKKRQFKQEKNFLQKFANQTKINQSKIIKNLDDGGWSGIHYAVEYNIINILQYIFELNSEEVLNIVTKDGQSVLFMCLRKELWDLMKYFLNKASQKHCQIQTMQGSFPHELFRKAPFDIIENVLLEKKVDPFLIDYKEKTVLDCCREEIKAQVQFIVNFMNIPEKPIGIIGEMLQDSSSFFSKEKKIFMRLNVENRSMEIFTQKKNIPFKIEENFPLKLIKNFQVNEEEKTIY